MTINVIARPITRKITINIIARPITRKIAVLVRNTLRHLLFLEFLSLIQQKHLTFFFISISCEFLKKEKDFVTGCNLFCNSNCSRC